MKRNTSLDGASHNPAAAGERAGVLTGHDPAAECAIVGNLQANTQVTDAGRVTQSNPNAQPGVRVN